MTVCSPVVWAVCNIRNLQDNEKSWKANRQDPGAGTYWVEKLFRLPMKIDISKVLIARVCVVLLLLKILARVLGR